MKLEVEIEICEQCSGPVTSEAYRVSHEYANRPPDSLLVFCSLECLLEHMVDTHCGDRIDRTIKREFKLLHAQVCPACARRLARLK